jgi:hypothetical protein
MAMEEGLRTQRYNELIGQKVHTALEMLSIYLAIESKHLDYIRYGSQVGNIFLREEGDCNAPLARPARSSDTVYVRNSRLRERETMEKC